VWKVKPGDPGQLSYRWSKVSNAEFKICRDEIEFLRGHWEESLYKFDADQDEVEGLFSQLIGLYSAGDRAYHNLSHIRSLVDLSGSFLRWIENHQALSFAIWFHDAIYNTRKTDNEELSAKFAVKSLGRFKIPIDTLALSCEMIHSTRGHLKNGFSDDINFFLDLDLAILGSEEPVYRSYTIAIREEYRWAPDQLYNEGRKKVLERFLQRESIYLTSELSLMFEEKARRNIAREIESLSARSTTST
jgi:predicted metal-dependent HD superfamily phosphohydrolase